MARMARVLNANGCCVEEHPHGKLAQRAALVLSAHDIKNGRVGNYRCDPPTFYRYDELDLPEWVLQVLGLDEET